MKCASSICFQLLILDNVSALFITRIALPMVKRMSPISIQSPISRMPCNLKMSPHQHQETDAHFDDAPRNDINTKLGGFVRFSGISSSEEAPTSPLDYVLRILVSDIGSIVLGTLGLTIAVILRLQYDSDLSGSFDALGQETRTDLLAVFACGAVLLNGLSKLDVTSALAESVVLDGIDWREPKLYPFLKELELCSSSIFYDIVLWALPSLLAATPAKTAIILEHVESSEILLNLTAIDSSSEEQPPTWITAAVMGMVPRQEALRLGTSRIINPILDRFLERKDDAASDMLRKEKRQETYLPTLQALPGRVEFTYLPPNTQEVLLLSITNNLVLVLGSNTAKSFSPRDIAWCQVIVSRMGSMLLKET
jgi:Cofactor assembly of complex C subunit B, CCB2/CCB4